MSASVSISKLKSELRQAQRLLSRNDRLNASLRVETERRVESLKSQIEEEQKRRGVQEGEATSALTTKATAAQNGSNLAATADASKNASETAPAVEKKKKSTKKEDKYKMLRHVEFKKSTRRLKQAERDLASVTSQLEALPASDGKDSCKARKALEKQKSAAEAKRDQARIDAWYGSTFPPQFKYVALYPSGNYVEFGDLPALQAVKTEASAHDRLEAYTAAMPPARKPDDVRNYWRAVVKARLEQGDLEGNPQSSNTSSKASKSKASTGAETHSGPAETSDDEDDDANEVDDFFE